MTTQTEAREELRKTCEGYMTDSLGAAREYLESDAAAELLKVAGLDGQSARAVLRDLTGVSI